jgi:hypothetical protein
MVCGDERSYRGRISLASVDRHALKPGKGKKRWKGGLISTDVFLSKHGISLNQLSFDICRSQPLCLWRGVKDTAAPTRSISSSTTSQVKLDRNRNRNMNMNNDQPSHSKHTLLPVHPGVFVALEAQAAMWPWP